MQNRAEVADTCQSDRNQAIRVNGVMPPEAVLLVAPEELRTRACTELLRRAAQAAGLLAASDAPMENGAVSKAASDAIEALLAQEIRVAEPTVEACRRHYAADKRAYRVGERVRVRHILIAAEAGPASGALHQRAQEVLRRVSCRDAAAADRFGDLARRFSDCPSREQGGELGWLTREKCPSDLASELFGHTEVGVLSRIVQSSAGLHVVEVQQREFGVAPPFEAVEGEVAMALRQQSYIKALRRFLRRLACAAAVEGIEPNAIGIFSGDGAARHAHA